VYSGNDGTNPERTGIPVFYVAALSTSRLYDEYLNTDPTRNF
jgi:hypothetical protein